MFHSRQEEAREVDALCFPVATIKSALIWGGSHERPSLDTFPFSVFPLCVW